MKRSEHRPWRGIQSHRHYTDNAIKAGPLAWRGWLKEFAEWLERDRGLAVSSVTVRVTSVRSFLQALDGGLEALQRVRPTEVEEFIVAYAKDHGPAARRSMQAAMRAFLRFVASRDWVDRDLWKAVPSLRTYRLSSVPRGIDDEGVRALVRASMGASARDRALVLLFVFYGIRRGQACSLQLEDVDWRRKTIYFRPHKGGKAVRHTLAPAVAEALAEYVRYERPDVGEQAVFLRTRKPHGPLGPTAVTWVVRNLFRQSGRSRSCSPHTLRHAFATRLLRNGHSLKVIADLLGHRSLETASIYAKVDHPRLLEVATEWPEVRA